MPGLVWPRVRWARIYRRRKKRLEVVAADELVEFTQKQKTPCKPQGVFFCIFKRRF